MPPQYKQSKYFNPNKSKPYRKENKYEKIYLGLGQDLKEGDKRIGENSSERFGKPIFKRG